MLAVEIPPGTTIESLLTQVLPELHGRLVPGDVPATETFDVVICVEGRGSWTARIRGSAVSIERGAQDRPTFWVHTTPRSIERFLADAAGPRRLQARFDPVGGVATMSDPRVLRRVAMASGRIELAVREDDGERLAIVFGFGAATRRAIDPDDAEVVIEATLATIDRVLGGELAPEEALGGGHVSVRGNRLLALQLALAVAPFFPPKR
jgi:hypothetical protein